MADLDVVLVNVDKTFDGDVRAVIDFNAEIEHSEFVAMLGPSGCGKTTTLRMIGGLEEVTEGKIYIAGQDVTDLPPSQRDTSMMFQSFALFPHRNVHQNVEFSLKVRGENEVKFSLALLIIAFVCPALAQECRNLSAQMKHTQKGLYEYALIAEAAYGGSPSNFCLVEENGQRITTPEVDQRPLLPQHIDTRWEPEFLERWQAPPTPPDHMGRYVGDNGVTYVTCTDDNIAPQLALTWKEFRRISQNEDALPEVAVDFEIRPVVHRAILPPDEEIGITYLRRDSSLNNGHEELVAIRGTDFTRVPQIMASLRFLLSHSCVYQMAAIVVDVIGDELSTGRISAVGHSLGGGAVQYIVQDHASHPWRNPENGTNSNVMFAAYSFNALGLDRSSANNADPSNLHSYVIEGIALLAMMPPCTKNFSPSVSRPSAVCARTTLTT